MKPPAVVLLSGGFDSTTVMAIAKEEASSVTHCPSDTANGMRSNWNRRHEWLRRPVSAAGGLRRRVGGHVRCAGDARHRRDVHDRTAVRDHRPGCGGEDSHHPEHVDLEHAPRIVERIALHRREHALVAGVVHEPAEPAQSLDRGCNGADSSVTSKSRSLDAELGSRSTVVATASARTTAADPSRARARRRSRFRCRLLLR